VAALHAASQPAAPRAACGINSNAINSTGLGHGLPWLQSVSQPADRPVTAAKLLAYMQVFFEMCHFFGNDDPLDIKLSRCFAHGPYASACKISPSYDTAFRRR